ncbi:MAG: potassium channel family protein [Candidatus Omnitrophica bacterium]|nr:potassium channel family protein [Candidatus Omnitrophota bacterium]
MEDSPDLAKEGGSSKDPKVLEQLAYSFITDEKFDEAFKLLGRAAHIYKSEDNHRQAALCFASAAGCWSTKAGEKRFLNSASFYKEAAEEAKEAGDLEYASILYKHAAINFERDLEFTGFSDCFYESKECHRKFLWWMLVDPSKIHPIKTAIKSRKGILGFTRTLLAWIISTLSFLIWGHGERPTRAFFSAVFLIIFSAFVYSCGTLASGGVLFKPDFLKALYFSAVTFTTVGYGDVTPVGLSKIMAVFEAMCQVFIFPLFMVSLTRKYLRF